jgi:hypothetical protein
MRKNNKFHVASDNFHESPMYIHGKTFCTNLPKVAQRLVAFNLKIIFTQ